MSAPLKPVGEAGTMPGTDGFTMACFKAADVPVGTPLFTHPPAPAVPSDLVERLNKAHDPLRAHNLYREAASAITSLTADRDELKRERDVLAYKLDQAVNTNQPMIISRAERAEAALASALEALKIAQSALAMMISPDSISQTTVTNAFAHATEAEVIARATLISKGAST